MTENSNDPSEHGAGDDQTEYAFHYGRGRMPAWMKLVWVAFLIFGTWYVVHFLLTALGKETGA